MNKIVIRFPVLPKGAKYNYPLLDRSIISGKNTLRFSIEKDDSWRQKLVEILEKLAKYYLSNPKIRI